LRFYTIKNHQVLRKWWLRNIQQWKKILINWIKKTNKIYLKQILHCKQLNKILGLINSVAISKIKRRIGKVQKGNDGKS